MLITDAAQFATIGSAASTARHPNLVLPRSSGRLRRRRDRVERRHPRPPSAELEPAALQPSRPRYCSSTPPEPPAGPSWCPAPRARLISGARRHYPDEPITRGNRTAVAGHFNHLVCYVGLLSAILGNLPTWTIGDHRTDKIIEVIEREKINIFFAFPDIYVRIYREGLPKRAFRSVRIWVTTADASHRAHVAAFCRTGGYLRLGPITLIPSVFVEAFGASEVGSAALRRISMRWFRSRSVRSVGRRTLAGPRVRVAGTDGQPAPPGAVGRIEVKGATVFDGYWDPEDVLRHDAPVAGWWWTGDLGFRSSNRPDQPT